MIYIQPILQTDRRLPRELGIGRWGCLFMSLLTMAQYRAMRQFAPSDVMRFYDAGLYANTLRNDGVHDGVTEFTVLNMEKVVNTAFGLEALKLRCYHIGDRDDFLGYRTPHRTDYTILKGTTLNGGPHWMLGDGNGEKMWDPDPVVEAELTGTFLRFRIDEV